MKIRLFTQQIFIMFPKNEISNLLICKRVLLTRNSNMAAMTTLYIQNYSPWEVLLINMLNLQS